ncbi:uncharacterized protein [Arachis hypogaea]|uniref:uncharacterized protein n=1 Tax=Arachis hypogaea TaxID=3818 RepID=UPI003B224878
MRNFITKINNGKVRKTAHKNKLNFYTKTEVEVLPIKTFAFNPFKFCTFVELEANAPMDGNLLFDEINATIVPLCTKEEVFNMTQKTSCWIVGNIVSLEVGKYDWSYTACKTCPKKVLERKDRYRLQVVVTDGSGYIKFLLWNKEAEQMVEKAAKKIKELCCSQHVPKSPTNETGDNSNGHETVYLFKDSSVESNGDSSYETLAKRSFPDIGDGTTAEAGVSANVQASANKIFKGNYGQKKLD